MAFFTFAWFIGLSLFAFGLLIGALSPTFGIGGGLVTVPILILVYHFGGEEATATSLGVIIFTSLSGTLAYIREKRIDFKVAFAFLIFAVPGSVSGALLARYLKSQDVQIDVFQIIFAVTMMLISLYKIYTILRNKQKTANSEEKQEIDVPIEPKKWTVKRSFEDKRGVHFEYEAKLFPGIIVAFVGGFIGALLGLGGGVIYVPILTMALGIPAGIATATSTFTILIANPFAVSLRWASIHWDYVICLAAGTIISAWIVPRFLSKIKSELILTGFWTLAMLAAIRLILKVAGVHI
ncbi:MAG: sulfite exporter TauE/SafE family protein [Candidatus Heimdallarchaeaceae archaeon]